MDLTTRSRISAGYVVGMLFSLACAAIAAHILTDLVEATDILPLLTPIQQRVMCWVLVFNFWARLEAAYGALT